ncbi:hypothetical protein PR202_ga30747 [Eleusine coracana subsp. coracana]|uniref:CCHC-type domain-containing protein n=1 Tax=Eleusine coracana subsp. coracana TaxID=191504 RepID=A0AAV5DPM1_ELECO|nr:hypothetical protein PR202_ga30747 [Eleusine coracana subsp. coracana]
MMRDGALPPAGAGAAAGGGGAGAGGDGPRRCSQCGHHGHNARTCTARPVKLFGVRIGDKPIRKSASMGNIATSLPRGAAAPGRRGTAPTASGRPRSEVEESADQPLSRSSSQEIEQHLEDQQPILPPPAPVSLLLT